MTAQETIQRFVFDALVEQEQTQRRRGAPSYTLRTGGRARNECRYFQYKLSGDVIEIGNERLRENDDGTVSIVMADVLYRVEITTLPLHSKGETLTTSAPTPLESDP